MSQRRYVASGNFGPGGLLQVALAAVLSGLGGGLILGFVSQWVSLLVIFPVVLGPTRSASPPAKSPVD